jgi:hypothetical protein
MAWPLIYKASRVFFVIEGCLKADAILSKDEAVFSVPSVSLWHAPELGRFAERYLRGKTVIVVPDADWVKNDLVIAQARFAERFLDQHGIRTFVATPSLKADRTVDQKGVDDYLGAGGKLDNMMVMERSVSPHLAACVQRAKLTLRPDGRRRRNDGLAFDAALVKALAHHADEHGSVGAALLSFAKIMDVHHSTVSDSIARMEAHGWVTVEGDLTIRRGHRGKMEWKHMPRIIIDPLLQGTDVEWPLRELPERLALVKAKSA